MNEEVNKSSKESNIDDEHERILVELTLGRLPKNEYEKKLLEQINEISNKGGIVDIPG